MKTIAFFQGYFLPHTGGIERYTFNLVKELHKKGYNVIIVTTKYQNDLLDKEITEYATIYRLPIYKLFSSRYPIIKKNKNYRRILKDLENINIDSIILNTRFQLTTLIGAKFAKKNKIPVCVIEHGTSHFTVYNKILDCFGHIYEHLLTNKIKSLVKDFYGVSKAACDWLKHYNINAKGVFYNSIDKNEYNLYKNKKFFENKDSNQITILFAGRLLKDKGILLLVEAFNELKKKYDNIELVIAGDGPLENELKKYPNITLTGKLNHEEIMSLYNEADICVNPSYSEGMPTSILEAGLMKCAIIATPVGGTVEIINNETTGLFCSTTSESIKEKIQMLIEDKVLRKILQENIHNEIGKKFVWDITSKKIIETIKVK